MSAPPRSSDSELSKKDKLAVSSGALMDVPWHVAGAAGAVAVGADLLLHLMTGHISVGSALSAGVMVLFAVAGAGLMLRKRVSRAAAWARRNPWAFAVIPGVATAAVVFVLSVIIGNSGLFGGTFTSVWHGCIAFGVTGVAAAVAGTRGKKPGRSDSY